MSFSNIFEVAGSGMAAQQLRLSTTASNMANANSASGSEEEAYRARHPIFSAVQRQFENGHFRKGDNNAANGGVEVIGVVESDAPLEARYEPNHPHANEAGYVYYPNVNVVEEMTNMIAASRSFQMNVEVMNSAKQMVTRALSLGQ